MRSRFLRLGCRGVGTGIGGNGNSVLVVVEVLLVSRLLPAVVVGLLLVLPVLLSPLTDDRGMSDVLEYGTVLL
jgi:hypothetical protein